MPTKTRPAPPTPTRSSSAPVYIKPGIEDDFLLKMDQKVRQEAVAALHTIYGDRPKPKEGPWLGYLIALGTKAALAEFAKSATPKR